MAVNDARRDSASYDRALYVYTQALRANGPGHALGLHRRACLRHAADGRRRPAVREPSAVPDRSRRGRAALPRGAREPAMAANSALRRRCSRSSRGRTVIFRRRGMRSAAACRPGTTQSCTRMARPSPSTTPSASASTSNRLRRSTSEAARTPWVPDYDTRRLAGIVGIDIRVDKARRQVQAEPEPLGCRPRSESSRSSRRRVADEDAALARLMAAVAPPQS